MTHITKDDNEIHPMTIYVKIPEYEKARKYAFDHNKKFKNIKKLIEHIVHQGIKTLCVIVIITTMSCSHRVIGTSLIEQRKAHTQRLTTKDITHIVIGSFVCIGIGMYIEENIVTKY